MQYIITGRRRSLPLCHVQGNDFKWVQKGFNGLRLPANWNVHCGDFSYASKNSIEVRKWYHPFWTIVHWTHFLICIMWFNVKGKVCRHPGLLLNSGSSLLPHWDSSCTPAGCIVGVASAAWSLWILSPDPDSYYLFLHWAAAVMEWKYSPAFVLCK